MTTEHMTVDPPKHPLPALTTYELADYRRELERAIAFFDRQAPVPPARAGCKPGLMTWLPSRTTVRDWPMPDQGCPQEAIDAKPAERGTGQAGPGEATS